MNLYPNIHLGYACINLSLKPQNICCNRTCRLATIQKHHNLNGSKGVLNFLTELSLNNLKHLQKIIEWNIQNNIHFYRLSSDMFPHISQPELNTLLDQSDREYYQSFTFCKDLISDIAIMAYNNKIRITMHPGQFNQLGSPKTDVVEKTFIDLGWQCRLLDIMEKSIENKYGITDTMKDSILCIHGGGTYGDKDKTILRLKQNFLLLPSNIQRRIALENCEKGYSVEDLLPICRELNVPLILDFHHYQCYFNYHQGTTQKSLTTLLPDILNTWKFRGMKPKFHLSDQAPGKMIGAHADYVESIPNELFTLMEQGEQFDIMIEAKSKDLATLKLVQKYTLQQRKPRIIIKKFDLNQKNPISNTKC